MQAYFLLFDKVFSELFERNFNPQLFRYRSWFEAFLYFLIGDGGGVALKGQYSHITVAVGSSFDSLHITIVVGGHSESKVLAH